MPGLDLAARIALVEDGVRRVLGPAGVESGHSRARPSLEEGRWLSSTSR